MKVFYHTDQDGECSAALIYLHTAKTSTKKDYVGINYGHEFPFDSIKPEEDVWIVDYSISTAEMTKLLKITKNVKWIDHHKTAIETYSDYDKKIEGIRLSGLAGCELTWLFLNNMSRDKKLPYTIASVDKTAPDFVRFIGDRDVWRHALGKNTTYFNLGMSAEDTHPLAKIWEKLSAANAHNNVANLLDNGKVIEKFRDSWAKGYRKGYACEVEFEGHKCLAMNLGSCGSEYFGDDAADYDILIPFAYKPDENVWKISLYSGHTDNKVDVSVIAKKYGGGGHAGASGMQCTKLPWLKK